MKGTINIYIVNADISDADQIKVAMNQILKPWLMTQVKATASITIVMEQLQFHINPPS